MLDSIFQATPAIRSLVTLASEESEDEAYEDQPESDDESKPKAPRFSVAK
jgi:hypothetical protein